MAFLDSDEIWEAYEAASSEADVWRKDYPEYERLMDNGLMEGLDENLPEVNDGSLAASLFKLSKRVIKKKLTGRAVALDRDDAWLTELANLRWEKSILKNANAMATPRRKWKDAVRKAAGYGGQPIITIFTDHGADFIVPYAQDVKLEAGKASDMDSDIIFWDVYYTKLQVKNMIEDAEAEEKNGDGYNKWDIQALKDIVDANPQENRPGNQEHDEKLNRGINQTGIHFYIAYQRGKDAPFYMCHNKKVIREWSNPDPSGDIPVHYLYCYQDFINPYGIGIVKLAGGTQNVLDYMRQADILATEVGISPPKLVQGNMDDVDLDSMVMARDATWEIGTATVTPWNMANGVYQQLPERISMYQTSLQKVIPMGDSSISSTNSGDPQVGRTPQALKMADANLSIDDEDFAENVDECYALVAKSMINTEFANMQGSDIMKLTADEREVLTNAGIEFPLDENGEPTAEFEIFWDDVRATFDFEVDPDADKTQDEEEARQGLLTVLEILKDPSTMQMAMAGPIIIGNKKVDPGELLGEIMSGLTENDKIITDISPEEMDAMNQQQMVQEEAMMAEEQAMAEQEAMTQAPMGEEMPMEEPVADPEQDIQDLMTGFGVTREQAMAMLEAEAQGFSQEEIMAALERNAEPELANV